jgi:hypothetical protein
VETHRPAPNLLDNAEMAIPAAVYAFVVFVISSKVDRSPPMTDKAKTQAATPFMDRQVVAELVARAQADGPAISGNGTVVDGSVVGYSNSRRRTASG